MTTCLLAVSLFAWNSIAWFLVTAAVSRQIFLHARVVLAYYADGHAPNLHPRAHRLRSEFTRTAVREALVEQDGDDAGFTANPHGDAAARRGHITAVLTRIVESLGYNPYFHSISNREMRQQYPGSRQILDSKDAITYDSRQDDPYPANAAHVLNDVDYHFTAEQMYKVLDRDEPLFAYSYAPRGTAGVSDGVRYSFNGETWDFAVPNTPYKHALWDLEGEARILTRNSDTAKAITAILAVLPVLIWCLVVFFSNDPGTRFEGGVCVTDVSIPIPWIELVWPVWPDYVETDSPVLMLGRIMSCTTRFAYSLVTAARPRLSWDESTRVVPCATWLGLIRRLPSAFNPIAAMAWAVYACCCAFIGICASGATSLVVRLERIDLKQARCIYVMIPCRRYSPLGTWLLAMSCAVYGDTWPELKRLKPTVSEGYAKMVVTQILGGRDATYVSVKRLTAMVDVRVRLDAYNALETTVRNLGKTPGGQTAKDALTAENKLHTPFVMRDDGESEDITAHRALLVANAVSAFFTHNDYRVSVLHRDGRALLGYTMGADDPDGKATLRVWSNAVIGDAAPHPLTSPTNLRAGVEVRVQASRNVVKPTEVDIDIGHEFVSECNRAVREAGMMPFKFASVEEVNERQPRPSQQALLREPTVTTLREDAVCDGLLASMKTKEATRKPRVITTPRTDFSGNRFKLHSSALGYGLAGTFKALHWSWSGLNHRRVADRIVDLFAGNPTGAPLPGKRTAESEHLGQATIEVEGDFTNMDGSHGLYEYLMFKQFVSDNVDPADREDAIKILDESFYNPVTGKGVTYDQAWALGSGLWLTTLYNTFTGALLAYRARRKILSESIRTAYRYIGGHSGDDSIMRDFESAEALEDCYAELGYVLKATIHEAGSRNVSFLARIYDTRDGSSVPDVARALKKRHTTGLPADVDRKTVAYSKWGPTYIDDRDCGTFGMMAEYIMKETNPERLGVNLTDTIKIMREHATANGWRGRDGAYQLYSLLAIDDYARPYAADWAEDYLERDDVLGINGVAEIRAHIHANGDPYAFPTIRVEAIKPAPIAGGTIAGEPQRFDGVGLPEKKQVAKNIGEAQGNARARSGIDQIEHIKSQKHHAAREIKAVKAGWGATMEPALYDTIRRHGPLEFARFKNEGSTTARHAWTSDQAKSYADRDRDLVAADWATARRLYPASKDRVAPAPVTRKRPAAKNKGKRKTHPGVDRKGKGPAVPDARTF